MLPRTTAARPKVIYHCLQISITTSGEGDDFIKYEGKVKIHTVSHTWHLDKHDLWDLSHTNLHLMAWRLAPTTSTRNTVNCSRTTHFQEKVSERMSVLLQSRRG